VAFRSCSFGEQHLYRALMQRWPEQTFQEATGIDEETLVVCSAARDFIGNEQVGYKLPIASATLRSTDRCCYSAPCVCCYGPPPQAAPLELMVLKALRIFFFAFDGFSQLLCQFQAYHFGIIARVRIAAKITESYLVSPPLGLVFLA